MFKFMSLAGMSWLDRFAKYKSRIFTTTLFLILSSMPVFANTPRGTDWRDTLLISTPFYLLLFLYHNTLEGCLFIAAIGFLAIISGPGMVFVQLCVLFFLVTILKFVINKFLLRNRKNKKLTCHRLTMVLILPLLIYSLLYFSYEFSGYLSGGRSIEVCQKQMVELGKAIEAFVAKHNRFPADSKELDPTQKLELICPHYPSHDRKIDIESFENAFGTYHLVRELDGNRFALFCIASSKGVSPLRHDIYPSSYKKLPYRLPFEPRANDCWIEDPFASHRDVNLFPIYVSNLGVFVPHAPKDNLYVAIAMMIIAIAWYYSFRNGYPSEKYLEEEEEEEENEVD